MADTTDPHPPAPAPEPAKPVRRPAPSSAGGATKTELLAELDSLGVEVAPSVRTKATKAELVELIKTTRAEQARAKVALARGDAFVSVTFDPEKAGQKYCDNCGSIATWASDGRVASVVHFCDAHKPAE